ncbi:MAG: DEAD/DEAH box helicase family protein [Balneolales bacterium]|nr:DEAD/DEAH box helicase family protein [Balneolales bacterium]
MTGVKTHSATRFSQWFKGSKVVDKNGNPLKLYHGTNRRFDKFVVGDAPGWGTGIYLTDNPENASEFGDKVLQVYASIKKPVYEKDLHNIEGKIRATKAWRIAIKKEIDRQLRRQGYLNDDESQIDLDYNEVLQNDFQVINAALRELGYDGIIAQDSNNIEGSEIIAFYSEQVMIDREVEQSSYRNNQAAAPSLQAQREQRFDALVALYAKAIAAGKIKDEFKDAIELEFSNLGQEINLNFQEIYGKRRPQTTLRSVSQDREQGSGSSQKRTAPKSGGKSVSEHAPLRDRPSGSGQRHDARSFATPAVQKENYSLRTTPDIQLSRKERIELNRAAAALLKEKHSSYTKDELKTLSLYTGQGGLLSVDVGVLNQHYTRYSLARFMWAALIRLGFDGGWVLEPGCGVGSFIGTKPDNTNILAFDYDTLAVQIASSLYPSDDVRQADIKSFDFAAHQQYINAAIGNPPFGNYSRYSRNDTFADLKPKIHDHFILKMLETVRPGGLIAVISSTGTMDKKNASAREAMARMAHFLGAYRLPSSTFEANASTTVTTDVMFFQKRDTQRDLSDQDRIFITSEQVESSGVYMNAWYKKNPDCILGTLEIGAGQFGSQIAVRGAMDEDKLESVLNTFPFKALERVPAAVPQPDQLKSSDKVQLPDEAASANAILFILKQLISAQKELASTSQKAEIRTDLKKAINEHIKQYGWFDKSKIIEQYFGQSPDYNQLRTVARPGGKGSITFSDIVERDTIFNAEFAPKLRTDKLSEIILYCRQTGLRSDIDVLTKITGFSAGKIKEMAERDPSAFLDPSSGTYLIRPEYISGNLKEKLDLAKQAGIAKNITAITEMMPTRKTASQINFDLADVNTYMPVEVAKAYVKYATGGELGGTRRAWAIPRYNTSLAQMSGWGWKGDYASIIEYYLNGTDYPKQRVPAEADDQLKQKAQEDQVLNNNKMRRLIPKRFTEWIVEIADDEIRQQAVDAWNDTYNVTIEPNYTGETFSCANMGSVWTNGQPFAPRDHQKKWIEKALLVGAAVNAHGVGAGKTLSAILLAGLMKERGMANKPMFVVPSKVVEKWIDEYQHAFPGANVLNLKTDRKNKELMLSMAQQNDYDAIFVTHEGFKAIPNSPELVEEYQNLRLQKIRSEIDKISAQITDSELAAVQASASGKKVTLKNPLQKILKKMFVSLMNMEQKVSVALESTKLNSIYFDELGVDALIVDEAHNFKNLFLSGMAVELGIGVGTSSDRAEEAFAKFHYINQAMGNRNVFLLTATPTNNTPLEAYILLSAIAPHYIEQLKLDDVDSFINQYARVESVQTADMLGNFKDKLVVTGYKNLDTLRGIFNRYVEFIDTSDFPEVRRILPVAKYNPEYLEPGLRDQAIITNLNDRVDAIKSDKPLMIPNKRTGEDSRDNYLFVAGSGSRAAVDPAFYVLENIPTPGDSADIVLDTGKIEPDSKAGVMCKTLVDNYWKKSRDVEGKDGSITDGAKNGQLIFCDPITTTKGRNYHRLLRDTLVEMGIPKNEIAIINGGENSKPEQKIKIQQRFNAGEIRVIIGNTSSMGEGMDLNKFCTDIHHLDVPWKPSELTQRNGRGVRQGNVNAEVRIHYYLLRKSLDAYRYTLLNKKSNWIRELWYGKDTEMESEDTESGGWDYETIMMALLDDAEKQKALEISRDLKRAVSMYNNLSDDYQSFKANIVALKQERDEYSRGQATYAYANIESLPPVSADGQRTLKSLVNDLSPRGWTSGYVTKKDGGYESGINLDYRYSGISLGNLAISHQRDGQMMYAVGRLFDRVYYGSDTDYKALEKKLFDFVERFFNSYPVNRKTRIDKYEMYGQRVKTFESREEQTKFEVAEAAMAVLALLDKADRVTATDPAIGQYFDDRFMAETRSVFMSRKSWAEQTFKLGVSSGMLKSGVRKNPGGNLQLAYLGRAVKFHTDNAAFSGRDYMFSDAKGSKLFIVPANRVRPAQKTVHAPAAQRMHEEFKHYPADGNDYQVDLPDTQMKNIGYAHKIWYSSDKIMQPGDQKNKVNYYVHDFDAHKRPVYQLDDVLVIDNLMIDGRGILN